MQALKQLDESVYLWWMMLVLNSLTTVLLLRGISSIEEIHMKGLITTYAMWMLHQTPNPPLWRMPAENLRPRRRSALDDTGETILRVGLVIMHGLVFIAMLSKFKDFRALVLIKVAGSFLRHWMTISVQLRKGALLWAIRYTIATVCGYSCGFLVLVEALGQPHPFGKHAPILSPLLASSYPFLRHLLRLLICWVMGDPYGERQETPLFASIMVDLPAFMAVYVELDVNVVMLLLGPMLISDALFRLMPRVGALCSIPNTMWIQVSAVTMYIPLYRRPTPNDHNLHASEVFVRLLMAVLYTGLLVVATTVCEHLANWCMESALRWHRLRAEEEEDEEETRELVGLPAPPVPHMDHLFRAPGSELPPPERVKQNPILLLKFVAQLDSMCILGLTVFLWFREQQ